MFAAPTPCSFSISRSSGFFDSLWCSRCLIHASCVISSSFFSSLLCWTTWLVKSLMFAAPSPCSFSISRSSGFFDSLWCSRCLIHASCVISSSFFFLTSLLDNMVGQEFDVCRTFTLLFQHFALFRFLRLSMVFPLSYSCRLVFIFSSSLLDNMVIRESDVCRTFTLLFEHSALIVSIRLPVLLPQCPLLLICFLIIALSTSFSINLYNSCISVVFGPVVHLFDISSNNTCLSCMFFVCPIWDI